MGNAEDAATRLALGRVEHALNVQRLAFQPRGEAWTGDQVVQLHRQVVALVFGEEVVHVLDADLADGRLLNLTHKVFNRDVLLLAPVVRDDVGEQDVLARLHGVGLDITEREDAADGALDAVAEHLAILHHFVARCFQRTQDRHRQAGIAARRVNGHVRIAAQGLDAVHTLAGIAEALLPQLRLSIRVVVHADAFAARIVGVHPRLQLFATEVGKGEEQVADVALGIDRDDRDAIHQRLFDQRKAEACLAGAGHAQHHAMGHEILRIVEHQLVLRLLGIQVICATEVKLAELLVLVWGDGHGVKGGFGRAHIDWRNPPVFTT